MRIVFLSDSNTILTSRIARALVQYHRTGKHQLVAIATNRPAQFDNRFRILTRAYILRILTWVFNSRAQWSALRDSGINLKRLAKLNDLPFINLQFRPLTQTLEEHWNADLAISCQTVKRYDQTEIKFFKNFINIHTGRVPEYRGVMTSSFAILQGEASSEVSFHRMSDQIDGGDVIHRCQIKLDSEVTLRELSDKKSRAAVKSLEFVLSAIDRGFQGVPQIQGGTLYTHSDCKALMNISEPSLLTAAQIKKRIRAFGMVQIMIDQLKRPVTEIQKCNEEDFHSFKTVEGHWYRPVRYHGLPWNIYKLVQNWW